jgi:hypothetical protein
MYKQVDFCDGYYFEEEKGERDYGLSDSIAEFRKAQLLQTPESRSSRINMALNRSIGRALLVMYSYQTSHLE